MTKQRLNNIPFNKVDIALHWLVASGVLGLIILGIYMVNTRSYDLYSVHKSIGVILFVVIVLRTTNRLKKGWPEKLAVHKNWEIIVAKAVHWMLLISCMLMPLSGMIEAVMGGRGLFVFNLELFAANIGSDNRPLPLNSALADAAETTHYIVGYSLIAIILAHLLGALKHHIIDKDETLNRILGRKIN